MEDNFDDSVSDPTYKPPPKNKRGLDVTNDEDDIGDEEPMDDGDADITPPPPPPPPPPTISSTLPASGKVKNLRKRNVRFDPTATSTPAPAPAAGNYRTNVFTFSMLDHVRNFIKLILPF